MPSRFTDIHTRFSTLDGMRGIAAISVMFFHYTTSMPISIFRHAPLAVDIFFILSGFVIAHSYGNRLGRNMTALEYLLRRIIRLYPMFAIGLLAGSPILYLLYTSGLANYSTKDIINALLCNCFFIPYIGSKAELRFWLHELCYGNDFSRESASLVPIFRDGGKYPICLIHRIEAKAFDSSDMRFICIHDN